MVKPNAHDPVEYTNLVRVEYTNLIRSSYARARARPRQYKSKRASPRTRDAQSKASGKHSTRKEVGGGRKSPGGRRGRSVRRGPSSPCPSRRTWPPWSSRRATLFLPSQPSPPPLRSEETRDPAAEEAESDGARAESAQIERRIGRISPPIREIKRRIARIGPRGSDKIRRGSERGGSPYLSFRLPPTPTPHARH